MQISILNGQVITSIKVNKTCEEVHFQLSDGREFIMHHHQDCCEHVYLDDVCGDWEDILNAEIISASEESSDGDDLDNHSGNIQQTYIGEELISPKSSMVQRAKQMESSTWTFYRIQSTKGEVVLRWIGESNGFYSERVTFERVCNKIQEI